MFRISVLLAGGKGNAGSKWMADTKFDTPESVIEFVDGFIIETKLDRLEVTEFGPDGQLVECVGYDDFLSYYQSELGATETDAQNSVEIGASQD